MRRCGDIELNTASPIVASQLARPLPLGLVTHGMGRIRLEQAVITRVTPAVQRDVAMSHHVRPQPYAWGYDWLDDCLPPRVTYTHPPPAHARVALHLPPCQPRAGVNTDWSAGKCAMLHRNSSYALLPSHPPASLQAQPPASQPAPPTKPPVLQPAQPQVLQQAPPAQPTPPKPAAEPVTVGQAEHDHVNPEPAMANLGFDVAIGLCLALAFALVRRSIVDLIEPMRPSLEPGDVVKHETRR
jgi:hypothetical protein